MTFTQNYLHPQIHDNKDFKYIEIGLNLSDPPDFYEHIAKLKFNFCS